MDQLPTHLKKYVVEQNYEKYSSVDQACWRFILRQLKSFLGLHAHECYLEGLEKTGVEIEQIPKIDDISKKLKDFGWRALPVSGFIPPAAFMELQSLGILPIASDIRSLDHLLYTPAPDIVHEAAGHAPILIHPEFSEYLKRYSQVAKKAIISKEDLDLYEAIRNLSDIKENPDSTQSQIDQAQSHLEKVSKNISHVSEASELSRMNWWTAEYGLIGDIKSPKIFGAGLLSSVGESRWCLSDKVKKIPLSVDCLKVSYDITEPQPQLFVTPSFSHLTIVLNQMADSMAFKIGGSLGLQKALLAKSVNSVQYNSGLQVSGLLSEVLSDSKGQPSYLKFSGPCQLSLEDSQLENHGKNYHAQGFGSPVGYLKNSTNKCLSDFSISDLEKAGLVHDKLVNLEFTSGIQVRGQVVSYKIHKNKLVLLSFKNCTVSQNKETLFHPDWGVFDMAVGSKIESVFGGAADRQAYGEDEDFIAARVPQRQYSESEKQRHSQFSGLRKLREQKVQGPELEDHLNRLSRVHLESFPNDWLFYLESLEICLAYCPNTTLANQFKDRLKLISNQFPEQAGVISDGLTLAHQL